MVSFIALLLADSEGVGGRGVGSEVLDQRVQEKECAGAYKGSVSSVRP
jgi:hypothetical protein